MLRIAYFRDGPFLPPLEGGSESILGMMKGIAKKAETEVFLFRCYRGWDDYRLYLKKPFKTIFIKPSDFYTNSSLYKHLIKKYKINVYHFDSAGAISIQANLVGKNVLKVWEVLNVNHTLIKRTGGKRKEIKKAIFYELEAAKKAGLILARSEKDRDDLIKIGIDKRKIALYHGCISPQKYDFVPFKKKKGNRILFLGNMFYKPNEEAVKIIRNKIISPVVEKNQKAKFIFVGNYPKNLSKEFNKFKNVIFTGGIKDINSELSKAKIALAPLKSGSGTRLKILTYLAAGIPTIATNLAIEGLKRDIKKFLVIEDNFQKYPQLITRLLNSGFSEKLLLEGRKWVEKNYSWQNEAQKILNHYKNFLLGPNRELKIV